MLQCAATFVSSGRLVVAQFRSTERSEGTGVILGASWDPVLLLWRDDLHLERDRFHAARWLRRTQEVISRWKKNARTGEGKQQGSTKDYRDLEDELTGHEASWIGCGSCQWQVRLSRILRM